MLDILKQDLFKKIEKNKWLFILFVLFMLFILFKCSNVNMDLREGMENKKGFVYKNKEIYDEFYSNIYDTLLDDKMKVYQEIGILKELTKLDEDKNKYLLDVGCGTGHLVGMLKEEGVSSFGVDNSMDMVKKASKNYPNEDFKHGNVLDPFLFPKQKFSHITAFYFTVYYFKNKKQFFENSYSWLKPNGYLVIHLVDKHNFDPILNSGDPLTLVNPQDFSDKRITNSVVIFEGFEYRSNFELPSQKTAYFNEKFKFNNGDVRVNQHHLYMEDQNQIIKMAKESGFSPHKYVDLSEINYDGQYIYIFKKNTQ